MTSQMAFPIGEYIAEEINARGWSTAAAVSRLDNPAPEDLLWLDLICAEEEWEHVQFTQDDANKLEKILEIPAETFMRLHQAFLIAKAAERQR